MLQKTRRQISADASTKKRAKTNKQVGPDSHDWLLAEDVAREKRKRDFVDNWEDEPTITLGFTKYNKINPAFLGPTLKRRFLDENSAARLGGSIA